MKAAIIDRYVVRFDLRSIVWAPESRGNTSPNHLFFSELLQMAFQSNLEQAAESLASLAAQESSLVKK